MSQENVEVVRGIYEAVARHNGVTPFEVYAEDIVWDLSNSRRTALGIEPVYQDTKVCGSSGAMRSPSSARSIWKSRS
jgi:hypothetical protein